MHTPLLTGILAVALCGTAVAAGPAKAAEQLDINRATVAELLRVQGMTATWAARIVRFRPYRTKLDLVDKGVVTAEVYQRIRDGVVAHRVTETEPGSAGKKYDPAVTDSW